MSALSKAMRVNRRLKARAAKKAKAAAKRAALAKIKKENESLRKRLTGY